MPGGNCAIYDCSSSRTTPGVSLFKVPSSKEDPYMINWRNKILDIITRARVVDSSLRSQIQNCRLHVCELHYPEEKLLRRKCYRQFMKFMIILSENCYTTIVIRN